MHEWSHTVRSAMWPRLHGLPVKKRFRPSAIASLRLMTVGGLVAMALPSAGYGQAGVALNHCVGRLLRTGLDSRASPIRVNN
jgi:hypothetical protein